MKAKKTPEAKKPQKQETSLSEQDLEKVVGGANDYGFGVSMPVTTSRSDGGGATVGRANFDVYKP